MTNSTLLVPIHLDALVLDEPQLSVGPSAHFTRLPHVWNGADINPDSPNLGKSVVAPPFQDESFLLDKGVHLHWALPDALTRARHAEHELAPSGGAGAGNFPAVPNRWLVVRRHERAGQWLVNDAWVVESDYLWHEDHDAADHVSVPSAWAEQRSGNPSKRPYRLMGRQMAHAAYPAGLDRGRHLAQPLTAMGYGEPAFATIYQNCHSVFGLHDATIPTVETRYDVFGWYSDPAQDPLRAALDAQPDDVTRADIVQARFGWRINAAHELVAGVQTICFVSMTIPARRVKKSRSAKVEVSIGNTASEALSAYLAATIGGDAGRDAVEDQLESILLDPRLAGKQLDRAARLADARHEKGFAATPGGWIWMIKPQEQPGNTLEDVEHDSEALTAPRDAELESRLARLNELQGIDDRNLQEVEAARGQLFADWCKYMRVVYPPNPTWQDHATFDGDELREFIEQQLAAVDELVRAGPQRGEASALARARKLVEDRVAEINRSDAAKNAKPLGLLKVPGPRFYRPTEPALLIHGEAVRVSERHGHDGREDDNGLLLCNLSSAALLSPSRVPDVGALCTQVDRLRNAGPAQGLPADRIGFCAWEDPWHPILLEWEVDLFPLPRGDQTGNEDYARDHITGHFKLKPNDVELTAKAVRSAESKQRKTYQGMSILTPHARRQHDEALRAYVVKQCQCSHEHLLDDRPGVEEKHRERLAQHGHADDPTCAALRALDVIDGKEFLSQSLTGINDALLGLHQSYQLPIEDPLGFACERALAERVRTAVRSHNRSAPEDGGFDPLREGPLQVRRLRLIDTFGQIEDLDVNGAPQFVSRSLRAGGDGGAAVLPPRFVQPARVNLRWLSTTPAGTETGDTPAATPICGWVIVDNLDGSVLVYDANGRPLGVISDGSEAGLWQAGWQAAPGNDAATQVWHIDNPHLRQVAQWLVDKSKGPDWEATVARIDTALDNIDPEGGAHHEDLAVLMHRPLAVVRAQLSVSLAGRPSIHQGEHALFTDVRTHARRTDRFEDVLVPVRLGAHERANDGLVAYWQETANHRLGADHWPQSEKVAPILIAPASHRDPHVLTMLVDPLAEVHATSGVLPTKSITIPASMYAAQLKRMELTFRSLGPILTNMGRLDLPLPVEPGFVWSWLERDDRGWSSVDGDVGTRQDDGAFSGPVLAREGWLRLSKANLPQGGAPHSSSADAGFRDTDARST